MINRQCSMLISQAKQWDRAYPEVGFATLSPVL